jgi:sulfur-carrier protein
MNADEMQTKRQITTETTTPPSQSRARRGPRARRHGEEKAEKECGREDGRVEGTGAGGQEIAMPVSVRIPTYLAAFAGGLNLVAIDGSPSTVREALESLLRIHPALRDRILDEQGEVRQHINIFVGEEAIRFADGLATKVPESSEILIVPAVSGG